MPHSKPCSSPAGNVLLTLYCGALFAAPVAAECDFGLDGAWTLDYQHYLDQISKGDPGRRAYTDRIWDGETFQRFTFDRDAGVVTVHQRNKDGWGQGDMSYRIFESANVCYIELTYPIGQPDPQQPEVYPITQQGDRFCFHSGQTDKIEDCYLRE